MAHVSVYVVVWLLLSLLGVLLTVPALGAALRDSDNVQEEEGATPEVRIANRAALRNAIGRVVVKTAFLAAGIETLLAELGWRIPHFGDIFAWLFIIAIGILDALSIIDWSQRDQLGRAFEARRVRREALARVAALAESSHKETMDAIHENTAITRQADEHATASYSEANRVNWKIAQVEENIKAMLQMHTKRDAARDTEDTTATDQLEAMAETERDTNERVKDVQEKAAKLAGEPEPPQP